MSLSEPSVKAKAAKNLVALFVCGRILTAFGGPFDGFGNIMILAAVGGFFYYLLGFFEAMPRTPQIERFFETFPLKYIWPAMLEDARVKKGPSRSNASSVSEKQSAFASAPRPVRDVQKAPNGAATQIGDPERFKTDLSRFRRSPKEKG